MQGGQKHRGKGAAAIAYRRQVLKQVEGDYLLDYALFTGALRVYVTQSLSEAFERDKNDLHRRMFTFALYTQEYLAYEDLGAMLDALLTHRLDRSVPVVDRLMSYKPGEARLEDVMRRFTVQSARGLHAALGLDELVPVGWAQLFPDLDLAKALKIAAGFFFADCVRNQKVDGTRAFNKLKHGLMAVPTGLRYLRTGMIDAPAAIIDTPISKAGAAQNPISLFAIPMGDEQLRSRVESIHLVQTNLRLIAALMSVVKYPEAARRRNDADPLQVFREDSMTDVTNFISEVTRGHEAPW